MHQEVVFSPQRTLTMFLGLSAYLPAKERRALVRKWQSDARAAMAQLQARLDDHTRGATYGKPFAQWLLFDHEKAMLQAEISWLDTYLKMTGAT